MTDSELSREVLIVNELGLHARSATQIAKIAQNARAGVWLIKDGETVDAKSIIDILSLACGKDARLTIQVESEADLSILEDLVALVKAGFGELEDL